MIAVAGVQCQHRVAISIGHFGRGDLRDSATGCGLLSRACRTENMEEVPCVLFAAVSLQSLS